MRLLRRVIYRLRGPEGKYLEEQYGLDIKGYLDSGQYRKILELKIKYDLFELPIRELRAIARSKGVSYYTSLSKAELVRAIEHA